VAVATIGPEVASGDLAALEALSRAESRLRGSILSRLFSSSTYLKFVFMGRVAYSHGRIHAQIDGTGHLGESVKFRFYDREVVQANLHSTLGRAFVGYAVYESSPRPGRRLWRNVDNYEYLSTISHMATTGRQRILRLAEASGYVTTQAVSQAGIHTQELTRLVADGTLERVGRGRYRLASAEITEHYGLVLAAAAAPDGVICMLSALAFHGIGTQLPAEVWLAIERGRRPPKITNLHLRIVRFSGPAFQAGIEVHEIEGQRIRVYGVAKTIADLFKARNRVGLDVAVEALREAWRDRRFTMADLEQAARACRVERVMRPYVEGVVA